MVVLRGQKVGGEPREMERQKEIGIVLSFVLFCLFFGRQRDRESFCGNGMVEKFREREMAKRGVGSWSPPCCFFLPFLREKERAERKWEK